MPKKENIIIAIDNTAMDSARMTDINGYVTIKDVIITSAAVHPYIGKSIPNWKVLSLDPAKIYYLYRPLEEIQKSKDTFNSMPLLSDHIEISSNSENVPKIGTLGSTNRIQGNDLLSDITFWHQSDINKLEGVDANGNPLYKPKKGVSAGYRYTPVLESGVFNGKPYDIRMTNLIANHVAHVENPRNEVSIIQDGLNFDEESEMARKMGRDEGEEGSISDEIMDILQGEGDNEVKAKKIRVLVGKGKTASDEEEDDNDKPKDADKIVKDKKGRAKDEKDCDKANDEDDEEEDKPKSAKDRKSARDDKDKEDKEEYVAKDSIEDLIASHNRKYREALNLCSQHIDNAMALDTADDIYNAVINKRGANAKAFTTIDAKREFVKAINNMPAMRGQRVPSMAMDSVSSNSRLADIARNDINEWFSK